MTHTARMTTEPQRLDALRQANKIRLARAELKRQIAQGRLSAALVILESPEEANTWAVRDLLLSQRRWGNQRCRKFLAELQIPERKQIGTLTPRQRRALAGRLGASVSHDLSLISSDRGEDRSQPVPLRNHDERREVRFPPPVPKIEPERPEVTEEFERGEDDELRYAHADREMELAPA